MRAGKCCLWQSARLAGKLLDPSSSPRSLTHFGADAQGQLNKPTIPNPHPTPALYLDKRLSGVVHCLSPPLPPPATCIAVLILMGKTEEVSENNSCPAVCN